MARSWEQIVELTQAMMRDRSALLLKMREVQQRYEGDWVLPMPDMDHEPSMPPLTPWLIGEAIDKNAQRANAVDPMLICPAIDGTKDRGRGSHQYASIRRRALQAGLHESKWNLARGRAFRQLSAYYTTAMRVIPDFDAELPRVTIADPLGTFAETVAENDLRPPCYVAFVQTHSAAYCRKVWPETAIERGGVIPATQPDMQWNVVEWIDEDQIVFGLLGPTYSWELRTPVTLTITPHMMLGKPYPNRIGMIPVAIPANVTLSRVSSRLANLIGNVDYQAKLMNLDILAQEKAIFPDAYILGERGMAPRLQGGRWKDGRTGDINIIEDATAVGLLRSTPDLRTGQMVDRLERNFRVSAGLLPQYGGESFGSLRTGRALDSMMGIAIDPAIQELHEVMSAWMPYVNKAMIQTWKAYWGDKSYSMHSGRAGDRSIVTFTPAVHFETDYSVVAYPVPGADAVQQTQILGSLLGAKGISRRTFREMHPWIHDPDAEGRLVEEEDFEAALANSIMQQLQSGAIPLPVASLIHKFLRKGLDIFEAVEKADEEIRKLQAQQAPEPEPGQVMAPEAAPGIAGGPQQLQQSPAPPAADVQVPQGAERMKALMQAMGA